MCLCYGSVLPSLKHEHIIMHSHYGSILLSLKCECVIMCSHFVKAKSSLSLTYIPPSFPFPSFPSFHFPIQFLFRSHQFFPILLFSTSPLIILPIQLTFFYFFSISSSQFISSSLFACPGFLVSICFFNKGEGEGGREKGGRERGERGK